MPKNEMDELGHVWSDPFSAKSLMPRVLQEFPKPLDHIDGSCVIAMGLTTGNLS